jgi:hypothetical protein
MMAATIPSELKQSLSLHAGFDSGMDAGFARGDKRIYSAPSYKEQSAAKPGVGEVDVQIAKGEGIGGDALRFNSKNTRALFFKGERNISLPNGTLSFWLKLDPQKDLAPGFCDPIQLTDKDYNDSAIWVDFTKDEVPRHFRLGVFGNLKVWNPENKPPDKNPDFMRRLVVVERPPFSRERWTHVAVTWSGLSQPKGGTATLYLNGNRMGSATKIAEPFEWDPGRAAIRLGVNYTGLMDEVMLFDKALGEAEVKSLHQAVSSK